MEENVANGRKMWANRRKMRQMKGRCRKWKKMLRMEGRCDNSKENVANGRKM